MDLSNLASNSAVLNPFRYRGYYYDNESGFYYLQSRYYDPSIGRFINADRYVSTGQQFLGYNMFAYCSNNPVNTVDRVGMWTFGISLNINLTAIIGVSISIGIYVDDDLNFDAQCTYSVPGVDDTAAIGILGVGATASIQYTNRDTVYDLYGPASSCGATVGNVGVDMIAFSRVNEMDSKVEGIQFSYSLGGIDAGCDLRLANTNTVPINSGSSNGSSNNHNTASRGKSNCGGGGGGVWRAVTR